MQNFYEHQEVAESNSWSLIVMMGGAIVGTVLVTGLVLTATLFGPWCFWYLNHDSPVHETYVENRHVYGPTHVRSTWRDPAAKEIPYLLACVWYVVLAGATGACVTAVTWAKVRALRERGGAGVAEELGGVLLGATTEMWNPYRGDPDCERALHVVAEMAIAARLPTPPVYLLAGQDGVNAFAAGYTTSDAVIALTEGTVRKLNREQLQGVVAHEFAHVFNGDMRLNMRMLGYMHGLLGITICAGWLMQVGYDLLYGVGNTKTEDEGNGLGILFVMLGALLWPVGLTGHLFAALIKAAFSRQREFLADAFAVEFTRNAEGIAGALKKILGLPRGSRVRHPYAVECSHLFFANGSRSWLAVFQTHPPLEERILRIDPQWDGQVDFEEAAESPESPSVFAGTLDFLQQSGQPRLAEKAALTEDSLDDRFLPLGVGDSDSFHFDQVLAGIPTALWEMGLESPGAEVQILALWLATDGAAEDVAVQAAELRKSVREPVLALVDVLRSLEVAQRLLLLDAATATIGALPAAARRQFVTDAGRIGLDLTGEAFGKVSTASTNGLADNYFRWACSHMLRRVVLDDNVDEEAPEPRYQTVEPLWGTCEVLISVLSRAGSPGPMAAFAMQRAIAQLGRELTLRDEDECTLEALELALAALAELAPRPRRSVLLACGAVLSSDQDVNEEEACLMRGVSSALGFPPARILPGQPVTPGA